MTDLLFFFCYLRWHDNMDLKPIRAIFIFCLISVFLQRAWDCFPLILINWSLQSFMLRQSRKLTINWLRLLHLYHTWSAFPFHPCLCLRWRLWFMFRCLWFLHFHALTPTVITLQTSLKWINFSGSSCWIISCVHFVCDYCSVTPDADPRLCAVLYVWEECRHIFSIQIPQFERTRLSFYLWETHLKRQCCYFCNFITLWHHSTTLDIIFSFLK